MPVFDYRCTDCGKIYDIFHKGKEIIEDIVCPSCASQNYKKMMPAPAVSMNGRTIDIPRTGGGCANGMCGLN